MRYFPLPTSDVADGFNLQAPLLGVTRQNLLSTRVTQPHGNNDQFTGSFAYQHSRTSQTTLLAFDDESTSERAYVEAPGWGGPNMWFVRVPESKTAKNRMHFDLRAPGSIDAEVARLEALGASVVRVGADLTVMRDPEGNEFCVE